MDFKCYNYYLHNVCKMLILIVILTITLTLYVLCTPIIWIKAVQAVFNVLTDTFEEIVHW